MTADPEALLSQASCPVPKSSRRERSMLDCVRHFCGLPSWTGYALTGCLCSGSASQPSMGTTICKLQMLMICEVGLTVLQRRFTSSEEIQIRLPFGESRLVRIPSISGTRSRVNVFCAGAGSVVQHMVAHGGNTQPPLFKQAMTSSTFIPSQYHYNDLIPEVSRLSFSSDYASIRD